MLDQSDVIGVVLGSYTIQIFCFPLRISSVYLEKSVGNYGIIYGSQRNPWVRHSFLLEVNKVRLEQTLTV